MPVSPHRARSTRGFTPRPAPVASALARRRRLALALSLTVALALAGCGVRTSMAPLDADPGIGASLQIVESKVQGLFDALERNAAGPFAEYDAIHYRSLLDELSKAQRLARVHERPRKEREALDELAAILERFRGLHREGRLSFTVVQETRARLAAQLELLLRMERR